MRSTERPGRGFVVDYYIGKRRVVRSFKTAAARDAHFEEAQRLRELRQRIKDGALHDEVLMQILAECLAALERRQRKPSELERRATALLRSDHRWGGRR